MSISTPEELAAMRAAGRVVRLMLEAMKAAARSGITTADLDHIGGDVMVKNGARSGPSLVYQFPGVSCISVNDEIVHGVPSSRKLRNGDLLKLDVTIQFDGFMADAAETVIVGETPEQSVPSALGNRLLASARRAFHQATQVARAGNRVQDIGRAVEAAVKADGFHVIRELCGHGIGRTIHERPSVPNWPDPSASSLLTEGLVITIEPIIASKSGRTILARDGWTVRTADRGLAAHYEHTLVITKGEPMLLTAA
ncbi:MAG TPA: type I methionyl aminopeptidase [Acidobacteriaceae bacterium]|jgi:methionyl aminopeptidase|nr:type I methionyl aminopeptidase [Acidobacteriaceae bacterium]